MARDNYFNRGDGFSEWHRALPNKLGYVDIDMCGTCLKCKEPLYLAETAFDVGQPWKATTTTEWLAKKANLPSFLIFYKMDGDKMISFRVKQLTPTKSEKTSLLSPSGMVQVFELLQQRHNLICKKKDVA